MIKYTAQVTEMGPLTSEFIDAGMLVFFGADAPEELREFAILHDGTELKQDVAPGDMICIGDSCFSVLAVGEVANKNLSALGHFIVKFNGESITYSDSLIFIDNVRDTHLNNPFCYLYHLGSFLARCWQLY